MNNDINDNLILEKLKLVSDILVPIYWLRDHVIDFSGSSIAIEYENKNYLVTASHVIRDFETNRYGVVFVGQLQPIPFRKFIQIQHENVDLCVIELTREVSEISLTNIADNTFILNPNVKILLAGYPQSKFQTRRTSSVSSPRFIFTQIDLGISKKNQTDGNVNFYCNFTKENTKFMDGTIGTFPNPNGMSGGAALLCEIIDGSLKSWKLVGVMTDWDCRNHTFIRCTRSEIIIELIEKLRSNS